MCIVWNKNIRLRLPLRLSSGGTVCCSLPFQDGHRQGRHRGRSSISPPPMGIDGSSLVLPSMSWAPPLAAPHIDQVEAVWPLSLSLPANAARAAAAPVDAVAG